jgi:hypothetical protein
MHHSPIKADYGDIISVFTPPLLFQEGFRPLEILESPDDVSVANHEPLVLTHCILLSVGYILLVPKKLDIDWKAIEGLYTMGMKPDAIAHTYNLNIQSLRTRIKRGQWKVQKDALRAQKEVIVTQDRAQLVANAGTAYQQRLVKHIEAGMGVLDDNLPTTRPEVSQHFDALGKVDKIASRAYGLESTVNGGHSTTLNLNLLKVDYAPQIEERRVESVEVLTEPVKPDILIPERPSYHPVRKAPTLISVDASALPSDTSVENTQVADS